MQKRRRRPRFYPQGLEGTLRPASRATACPFLIKTLSPDGLLVETEAELGLSAEVASAEEVP